MKDRVYRHLRDGIIDGTYDTGAALREVEIASRLGVSKTPVREAFVRLEKDRLVELIPYRGAIVAGYSAADLEEHFVCGARAPYRVETGGRRTAAPQRFVKRRYRIEYSRVLRARARRQYIGE